MHGLLLDWTPVHHSNWPITEEAWLYIFWEDLKTFSDGRGVKSVYLEVLQRTRSHSFRFKGLIIVFVLVINNWLSFYSPGSFQTYSRFLFSLCFVLEASDSWCCKSAVMLPQVLVILGLRQTKQFLTLTSHFSFCISAASCDSKDLFRHVVCNVAASSVCYDDEMFLFLAASFRHDSKHDLRLSYDHWTISACRLPPPRQTTTCV